MTPPRTHRIRRSRATRRAGVYVLVLIITSVVTGMALLGLSIATTHHVEGQRVADSATARQLAASAVEMGVHEMVNSPGWRTARPHGQWLSNIDLGHGAVSVAVEGIGGGAYAPYASDPVQITGYGSHGDSRSLIRAQVALHGDDTYEHVRELYRHGVLGYWPLTGLEQADYETEHFAGNVAAADWSSDAVRPGMAAGLGASTAPWFTGVVGSFRIPSHSSYTATRAVSVWFWPETTSGLKGIVTRDASGRGLGGRWELAVNNGQLESLFDTSVRTVTLRGGTVRARQWNHAVFTFDGSQMRLYLNGQRVDSWSSLLLATELATILPTENIRVGVCRRTSLATSAGTNPLAGAVCELALISTDLSDDEALALYQSYAQPAEYVVLTDSWERVVE